VDEIYIRSGECKHPTKKIKPEMTPLSLSIFESTITQFLLLIFESAGTQFLLLIFELATTQFLLMIFKSMTVICAGKSMHFVKT
jgi:penicillin-binding protein-related factor A (putative recombinase)